jgi:hypothetical protein
VENTKTFSRGQDSRLGPRGSRMSSTSGHVVTLCSVVMLERLCELITWTLVALIMCVYFCL